jgi:hypothetical protein
MQRDVEAFLFEEAALLDTWRLDEWLGLFTADCKYVVRFAIKRRTVAAAMIAEPSLSEAKNDVRAFGRPYDAVGERFRIARWIMTSAWLEKSPVGPSASPP